MVLRSKLLNQSQPNRPCSTKYMDENNLPPPPPPSRFGNHSKIFAIIAFLLILAAVPAIVLLAQNRQIFQQEAGGGNNITGYVFVDKNQNGSFDSGEPGYKGADVAVSMSYKECTVPNPPIDKPPSSTIVPAEATLPAGCKSEEVCTQVRCIRAPCPEQCVKKLVCQTYSPKLEEGSGSTEAARTGQTEPVITQTVVDDSCLTPPAVTLETDQNGYYSYPAIRTLAQANRQTPTFTITLSIPKGHSLTSPSPVTIEKDFSSPVNFGLNPLLQTISPTPADCGPCPDYFADIYTADYVSCGGPPNCRLVRVGDSPTPLPQSCTISGAKPTMKKDSKVKLNVSLLPFGSPEEESPKMSIRWFEKDPVNDAKRVKESDTCKGSSEALGVFSNRCENLFEKNKTNTETIFKARKDGTTVLAAQVYTGDSKTPFAQCQTSKVTVGKILQDQPFCTAESADVSGDGLVNIDDYNQVRKCLTTTTRIDDDNPCAFFDLSENHKVGPEDLNCVLRYMQK